MGDRRCIAKAFWQMAVFWGGQDCAQRFLHVFPCTSLTSKQAESVYDVSFQTYEKISIKKKQNKQHQFSKVLVLPRLTLC